jgi:hypothetical protein
MLFVLDVMAEKEWLGDKALIALAVDLVRVVRIEGGLR